MSEDLWSRPHRRLPLNGLDPREARDLWADPYDWTDVPVYAEPVQVSRSKFRRAVDWFCERTWPQWVVATAVGLSAFYLAF